MLWTGIVVSFVSRVVYVLKFGGPPAELGVIFLLATLSYPVFLFCASAMLKSEVVNCIFDTNTWGRYTGLMLIASIMMAGSNIGLFLPVSFSDVGLCVWVGVLTFMSTYAQAVLLVGSQSGEVEV